MLRNVFIVAGTWEADIDRVLVPGQQTIAGVVSLRPATTYHLRIVAENEIGASEPSDTVTIITAEEGAILLSIFFTFNYFMILLLMMYMIMICIIDD